MKQVRFTPRGYTFVVSFLLLALLVSACQTADPSVVATAVAQTQAAPATPAQPTEAPAATQVVESTTMPISGSCNAFKENEQAPLTGQPRTGFDMTVGSPYHRQVVNVWKAPDGKEVSILLPAMPTQHEALKGYYGHLWQYPTGTGCDSNNLVLDAVNYARAKGRDHHTGQVWTLNAYLNGGEPLVKDAFAIDLANLPADPTK